MVVYRLNDWPEVRIEHARRRLAEVRTILDDYVSGNPLGFEWIESGPKKRLTLSVQKLDQPPGNEMALLIGEVANALRGALDSAVWQIIRDAGTEDFQKVANQVKFPIIADPEYWTKMTNLWLPGAPLVVVDRIRTCQPCEHPVDSPLHPLRALQLLSNQDKHAVSVGTSFEIDPEPTFEMEYAWPVRESEFAKWLSKGVRRPSGPIEVGAVVFSGSVPAYVAKIRAKPTASISASANLSDGGCLTLDDIAQIADYVQQAVWHVQAGEAPQEEFLKNPAPFTCTRNNPSVDATRG